MQSDINNLDATFSLLRIPIRMGEQEWRALVDPMIGIKMIFHTVIPPDLSGLILHMFFVVLIYLILDAFKDAWVD